MEYFSSMKTKTSITLEDAVLAEIDRLAGDDSRSAFIERVLRGYLRRRARAEAEERERARLDRVAEALNDEAADVLAYQVLLEDV